jgi:hypothetical protein
VVVLLAAAAARKRQAMHNALTTSSDASLRALIANTVTSGKMVVIGDSDEICGIS